MNEIMKDDNMNEVIWYSQLYITNLISIYLSLCFLPVWREIIKSEGYFSSNAFSQGSFRV